jgi:hypothetical protein
LAHFPKFSVETSPSKFMVSLNSIVSPAFQMLLS